MLATRAQDRLRPETKFISNDTRYDTRVCEKQTCVTLRCVRKVMRYGDVKQPKVDIYNNIITAVGRLVARCSARFAHKRERRRLTDDSAATTQAKGTGSGGFLSFSLSLSLGPSSFYSFSLSLILSVRPKQAQIVEVHTGLVFQLVRPKAGPGIFNGRA